jgi:DNA-binding MarR family transcriptional regulator
VAATRWLDDTEMRTWLAWVQATLQLRDRLDAELVAEHELSLPEYEVLAVISQNPDGRARMAELAAVAIVSRSRLTHLVDRLAHRGLVARQQCRSDRRGWFAVLTPAGRRLLQRAAPTHMRGVRRYLIDVLTPDEVATLGPALERVADAIVRGSCWRDPVPSATKEA